MNSRLAAQLPVQQRPSSGWRLSLTAVATVCVMSEELVSPAPVTRSELVRQLADVGVKARSVLMVHCSLSSLGHVIGGADTVVTALLETIAPSGTLVAMTGWDHDPYHLNEWPEQRREAYRRDPPLFDPDLSEAVREYGRLAERIRTWPNAHHSSHPEARFSAIGPRAQGITDNQPWDHPGGPGSPLAKLVEADGSVLILGAPLETLTVLHHAEELAQVPNKIEVTYSVPVRAAGTIEWRDVYDIDTSKGAFPYEKVVGDRDGFEVIAEEALASGIGVVGKVGASTSHLFPAKDLVLFAVAWMEKHFS